MRWRWGGKASKEQKWYLVFTFMPIDIEGQTVWLEWIESSGMDPMGNSIYRLLEKTPENERRKKVKLYKLIIVIGIILLAIYGFVKCSINLFTPS